MEDAPVPADPPVELRFNADAGDPGVAPAALPAATAFQWLVKNPTADTLHLAPPPPADFRHWWDHRVGWGVVLPEVPEPRPAVEDLAGCPEPVRRLIAERKKQLGADVPVFRYNPASPYRYSLLSSRAQPKGVPLSAAPFGVGPGRVPYYLLLVGGPDEIPWDFQFVLNGTHAVGRLALPDDALDRYVTALLAGWAGTAAEPAADRKRAVVWAVDHDEADITHLLREVITDPLAAALTGDDELTVTHLVKDAAGRGALTQALAAARPALVATSSHGRTGPLDPAQRPKMRADLGLPVDKDRLAVDPAALTAGWDGYGAVWFAHACCSAGGHSANRFAGLLAPGSGGLKVLDAVAALGPTVAPLPTALLGGRRPVRAFVGHVEPTFDWTVKHPVSGGSAATGLVDAFYTHLYADQPVGHALRAWYRQLGGLHQAYELEKSAAAAAPTQYGPLLYSALAYRDVAAVVVLGDPSVTLPPAGG